MKNFLMVAGFALLMVLRFAGSSAPVTPGSGQEWLSWNPAERNSYVEGFFDGYGRGSQTACRNLDQIFEAGQSHRLGDSPSARCANRLEHYSRLKMMDSEVDASVYTSVLTEFYSKHSEYQNIPVVYLMSFLTDSERKTADQLYQMALKGEMRTQF